MTLNIAEALRGIADSIETYGHYRSSNDGLLWTAAGVPGKCCLLFNPWLTNNSTHLTYQERIIVEDWMASHGFARKGSKDVIGYNDMHTAQFLIKKLRESAIKWEKENA